MHCLRAVFRVLVSALAIGWPGVVSAQSSIGEAADAAAELIEEFVRLNGAPGVAVSVGIGTRIVWNGGFGWSDIEQRVAVDPETTLFRVGSVAKPMTALAVAQLHERGALDLDAPVQRYVPSFPEKSGVITTRLLGGHLAGIRHYRGAEFLSQRHYATVTEGLEIFAADTLLFTPGTEYSYSSYGYNLVSAVVEGASGRAFLEYMHAEVFRPLGMEHTFADQVAELIAGRGRYYERDPAGKFTSSPFVDNSYKWAGGGFLSTSDDLVRFGFEHLHPTTISAETVAMLWTSQTTAAGFVTDYGIGWSSGIDKAGRHWAGHTGGSVGGTTFFRIYPDSQLVLSVIGNASSIRWGGLQDEIAELFLRAIASSND